MRRGIRYFCPVGTPAPAGHDGFWWPDVAFHYLEALKLTGLGVRVIPIGGAQIHAGASNEWDRWRSQADLFRGDLDPEFLNVVCAPIGLPTGTPQYAGPEHEGSGPIRPGDIIYEPKTALTGLWTADHRNIAITSTVATAGALSTDEEMLRKYDAVILVEDELVEGLCEMGIKAQYCPAEDVALASRFIGGM